MAIRYDWEIPKVPTMTATAAAATAAAAPSATQAPHRSGRWSEQEKQLFLRALAIFGSGAFRWKRISEYVGTRTAVQCKTHHQKLVNKAEREYAKRSVAATENKEARPKEECVVEYRMVLETAKRYRRSAPQASAAVAVAGASRAPPLAEAPIAQAPPEAKKPAATYTPAQKVVVASALQDVANPSYGRWTENEKKLYREAMAVYGKGRWKLVAKYVGTRTSTQCKTHHQKVVEKETKLTDPGGVVDDERFADAEEDETTPGREEAIVAKVLCDYRNDRPNDLDPFDYNSGSPADLVPGGNLNDLVQAIDPTELAAAGDPLVPPGDMNPSAVNTAADPATIHPAGAHNTAPAAADPNTAAPAGAPGVDVLPAGNIAEGVPAEYSHEPLPVDPQSIKHEHEMHIESL